MENIDPKPIDGTARRTSSNTTAAGASHPEPVKPDNFLAWSILSTIFCCLPFGIIAIVHSSQVDSYWFHGDHEGAIRSAKRARTWTWISVGTAVVCWVIYLLFFVVMGLWSYSSVDF